MGKVSLVARQMPNQTVYYPKCSNSELFLELIRNVRKDRSCLTDEDLTVIQMLGYDVDILEEVEPPRDEQGHFK